MQVDQGRARLRAVLPQDGPEILSAYEGFRSRRPGDPKAAMVEAKAAIAALRDALIVTERQLALEQKQLDDAQRRGRLAAEIPDPETVEVAERFAAKHRERISLLERKLAVQRDELVLVERDFEELSVQITSAGGRSGPADPPLDESDDPLRKHRMDRAAHEAAAEIQLAHLKRKLGRDKKE